MTKRSPTTIGRRQFVTGLGAAVAATSLTGCSPSANRRVAVVGAGLAGLTAAWELEQAGVEVRLFEQSNRAGGRVWTIRDQFDDGMELDAGAMGAGAGYTNWLQYCDAFGVKTFTPERRQGGPGARIRLDGETRSVADLRADPASWPIALSEDEKTKAPFGLLSSHLVPAAREVGDVANVLEPKFAHYDELSLLDFLKEGGASTAAIGLIERSLNYNSLSTVSTLSALRDTARILNSTGGSVQVEGGHSALTDNMAAALDERIDYRHELTAITQRDDGVRLHLMTPSGSETYDAARVIIAVPFTALRDVDIDPPLPAERREAIAKLPYTQIAKTFVQTRSRFWTEDADFSILYTDTRFERLFNLSASVESDRGLLLNWINGVGLNPFNEMRRDEQESTVVEWLKSLWPGNDDAFERVLTVNWSQSYAGGAYAHYAPGQLQRYAKLIPEPAGRLHFAGEHTELVAPGLEGAVTSGMRTAGEVIESGILA